MILCDSVIRITLKTPLFLTECEFQLTKDLRFRDKRIGRMRRLRFMTVIKHNEWGAKYLHYALDLTAIYLAQLKPEARPQIILVRWEHQFAMSRASPPSFRVFVGQPVDKFPETEEPRWMQNDRRKGRRHSSIMRQQDKTPEASSPEVPKKGNMSQQPL